MASHFGLRVSDDDLERMKAQARLYSKDVLRQLTFTSDVAAKQAEAGAALCAALGRSAAPEFASGHSVGPPRGGAVTDSRETQQRFEVILRHQSISAN